MARFKYFELDEFINSDTAKKLRIDNTPSFEVVEHLMDLTESFLEPLRAALGKPITVNSGYRCRRLNQAVGGVMTSVHMMGYAADITCSYMPFNKFVDFVVDWVERTGRKFDQILIETDKKGAQWLHIGLYNNTGQQRGQIKTLTK